MMRHLPTILTAAAVSTLLAIVFTADAEARPPMAEMAALEALPADSVRTPIQNLDLFSLTCKADTATLLSTVSDRFTSVECWNMNAIAVKVGPVDELVATGGRPICTTAANCPSSVWSMDLRNPEAQLACESASGGTQLDGGTATWNDGGTVDGGAVDGGPATYYDAGTGVTLTCLSGA